MFSKTLNCFLKLIANKLLQCGKVGRKCFQTDAGARTSRAPQLSFWICALHETENS